MAKKKRKKTTKPARKSAPKVSVEPEEDELQSHDDIVADLVAGSDRLADGVPVVGIGASAGGLDPIKDIVDTLTADSGMAFVIIQHLDPRRESHMADLLTRRCPLPVTVIEQGALIEPDHVYTAPSDRFVAIRNNQFVLSEAVTEDGRRLPINHFFLSLSRARGPAAMAVVLSGTGSDGTRGAHAIRAAEGLVIAQDPAEAQYPDMPQAVIATGMADLVLNAAKMPRALEDYASKAIPRRRRDLPPIADDVLNGILACIIAHTKSDFRHYKRSTIQRRICRRMSFAQAASPAEYLDRLRCDPEEVEALRNDLLIGVTSFFREPGAFENLRGAVIAPLVSDRTEGEPIRIWIPGCGTGEEAYSVAMLLHAEMRKQQKNFPLQIFASDIDENALEKARLGRYSAEAVDAVPEQYRRDAFGPVDGHFLVAKHLRDSIVFSCQNLVSDPPFSRLDLVSCRNVLIYLQSEAQRKVISLFAFALVPGAHLFLGKSDSISGRDDLFQLVDKDARIFRRRASAKPNITDFPLAPSAETRAAPRGAMAAGAIKPLSLAHINQEVLLEHYKAAVVIVDARGKILHFFGDATRFLQLPTGEADLDILAMARDRLGLKLRPALHRVTDGEAMAHIHDVPLRRNGDTFRANVTLRPLHPEGWHEPLVAIIFEEVDSSGDEAPVNTELGRDEVVRELERELAATKNELQATYEQFETSNEELKAANEEVMSMNEELQSANEELETSKEELQSINEELTTVNNQLSEKVDELGTTNNDLANLLNATPVAVVFLDQNMRIKRFTPKATDLFNLIPEDAGRPIEHISQKFAGVNIVDDARGVMAHLNTVEREVHTQDAWYLVRLLPYRTIDNRIEGVVAVFQDVTMHKVRQRLAITALDIMRRPAIVVDRNRSVVQVNESAREMLGYGHREIEGAAFHRLRGEDWNRPALRRLLDQAFDGVAGESPETLRIASPDQGEVAYRVRVTPSTGDAQSVWFVIVTLAPQDE